MFKDNLKLLLEKQNISQKDLAEYVGVKANTVSDWINKGTSPKIEHLCRISDFLKISLDLLLKTDINFTDLFQENSKEKLFYPNLTPIEKNILKIYNELNEDNQSTFIDYAYELKSKNKTKEKSSTSMNTDT